MFFTSIKRIIKAGFINFWRNGFVSLSSVLVMTIALFVIGSIIFSTAILKNTLKDLKNKADIKVYFVTTASQSDMTALQRSLEQLPEVDTVIFTSREQAFADFKDRHESDRLMSQVFDILGDNPLGASLTIKAKQVDQYETIADFLTKGNTALSSKNSASIIDDVNYYRNQVVIQKLTRIIDTGEKAGLVLAILLILISVMITLNTIRLAIYISREEISVMTLVGASNKYIRGPFIVSGVMYGVFAAIITLAIFYIATFWIDRYAATFFVGISLFKYYIANFWQVFVIVVGSGVLLGGAASYLAVRRYLRL